MVVRKWSKRAQSPNGRATPQAHSLSGLTTSKAHLVSVNEVGEDLRVGQAQGSSCTSESGFGGFKRKKRGLLLSGFD